MLPAPADADAIRYEGVSFSYDASRNGKSALALDGISLSVRQGERLGILGPNGGGKSTLVKLTLGLLKPLRGRISILGRTPHEARRDGLLGYVAQRNEAELAFPLSVRQVVSLTAARSLAPWRPMTADARESVTRALELVGVSDLENRPIGDLSGGQLQRVMIARALAGRPRILLLDEPTVGIDPAGQHRFGDLIRSLAGSLGITIVLVSHDIRAVAAACDRVACLSRTLHFHAAPTGLTPEVLAEVFQHDVAAIFGDIHVHAHPAAECQDPAHEHGHSHG